MPEPEPEPKAAAGAQQAAPDIPALDPEAEEQIGLHAEGEHFLDGRVPEPNPIQVGMTGFGSGTLPSRKTD
jgi:hypothetical protein